MRHSAPFLAFAALLLTAAGCSSENDGQKTGDARDPPTSASAEPTDGPTRAEDIGLVDGVTLEPGVPAYDEFPLSTGGTVRVELTTPAEGWFAHLGDPERGLNVGPESEWTGLLWQEATGVYKQPCGNTTGAEERIIPMTDSLRPLLNRDWVTVVRKPRAELLGGREAQHAVLVIRGCDRDYSPAIVTGGDTGSLPSGEAFDIWLVPLPEAGTAMVVNDPTGNGSDEVRQQWQQVVDSLEITVHSS